MKAKRSYGRMTPFYYVAILAGLTIAAAVLDDREVAASGPASVVTWDGGGATSNWSEGTNWSGNVVPGASDDVIFDATSTKDATIDANIAIGSIKIDTGY